MHVKLYSGVLMI